ncbi:hypothetical protein B1207_07655 [Legionella quinlivanii]|uniref:Uncharacterized protein n=1 Tax=Legionella quinlivanii TaxID=45073 RepID=A0A364LJK5_9GAMM|nr:hypothetical protein [Legionella quinlivanii]RAP36669.1 hypothetical protein B1207_07655 [Legionella quinlivanii]
MVDHVIVYELEYESKKCADIKAFNAATILIGSALEGIMLDIATQNEKIIKVLVKRNKTRKKELALHSLSLTDLLSLFKEAAIFPFDKRDDIHELYESMYDIACNIRNLIHPGRKIKAKFPKTSENEYLILESIYLNLKSFYYR